MIEREQEMELEAAFKVVFTAVIGYLMWKFKRLEAKVEASVDEPKVRQIIDDKLEVLKAGHVDLKEDLTIVRGDVKGLHDKLDRLIEKSN